MYHLLFVLFCTFFYLWQVKKVQFWISSAYFSQEIPFTFYHFFGTLNFFDFFPEQNPKIVYFTFLYLFHDFYF